MIPLLLLLSPLAAAEWHAAPSPIDSTFTVTSNLELPDCLTLRTHTLQPRSHRRQPPPGWSMAMTDDYGFGLLMEIRFVIDASQDNLYSCREGVSIDFRALPDSASVASFFSEKGFDMHSGENLWRISPSDDGWLLEAGEGIPDRKFHIPYPLFPLHHIAFRPDSPGLVSLPEFILRQSGRLAQSFPAEGSLSYGDTADSTDSTGGLAPRSFNITSAEGPAEGLWRLLDYSLDTDRAILGGDYTLRLLPSPEEDTLLILYERGATKMPDSWKSGDMKGILRPTGIPCNFELEWIGASGRKLAAGLRAEYNPGSEILTLHFPARGATLRFARLSQATPRAEGRSPRD